jgi:DNA-binding CsgD family transcriptional regulator
MNTDQSGETIKLRRNLTKLKHEGLAGIDYVRSKIFQTCETEDCGSYVCNLSTGYIEESRGFVGMLSSSDLPLTIESLYNHTHPEDQKKIHEILEALCALGKERIIESDDRLSCTYRVKFQHRYIQVNRKSGLAVKESTGEVLNWSNLYAMPNITPLDHVQFRWTGRHISHKDLMTYLIQKREKIFTRKELEILSLLLEEKSSSQIVGLLCVSPETLKKHLSNMFKKSGTSNRRQLLRFIEKSLKN